MITEDIAKNKVRMDITSTHDESHSISYDSSFCNLLKLLLILIRKYVTILCWV